MRQKDRIKPTNRCTNSLSIFVVRHLKCPLCVVWKGYHTLLTAVSLLCRNAQALCVWNFVPFDQQLVISPLPPLALCQPLPASLCPLPASLCPLLASASQPLLSASMSSTSYSICLTFFFRETERVYVSMR